MVGCERHGSKITKQQVSNAQRSIDKKLSSRAQATAAGRLGQLIELEENRDSRSSLLGSCAAGGSTAPCLRLSV